MEFQENILGLIGNTPLVRLNRLARDVKAQVYAKMENLNPGYSVKDRIGVSMIEAAEREGILKPVLQEKASLSTFLSRSGVDQNGSGSDRLYSTIAQRSRRERKIPLNSLSIAAANPPSRTFHIRFSGDSVCRDIIQRSARLTRGRPCVWDLQLIMPDSS